MTAGKHARAARKGRRALDALSVLPRLLRRGRGQRKAPHGGDLFPSRPYLVIPPPRRPALTQWDMPVAPARPYCRPLNTAQGSA